jgi:hypothetical protein
VHSVLRVFFAILLAACGPSEITDAGLDAGTDSGFDAGPDGGIPELPPADSPRYDEVWQIATHNSYWVNEGVSGDAAASGIGERLADQILFDHVRTLEIDVHPDEDTPRAFDVYHTTSGNSLCDTLAGCLASLRTIARVLPEHEVITVVVELKALWDGNFDAEHTIEDLDAIFEAELGSALYRPRDFMERCPGASTLAECALRYGWPETHELRGRVIATILGNWDVFGGQATRDWIDYATLADIRTRSAFPMASSWKLDYEAIPSAERTAFTAEQLDRAWRQSIFLQVQELADPYIAPTIARRAVIRVDGAFDAAAQLERIERGMQLLQTDYPWIQHDDRGPSQPFRAMDAAFGPLIEPGTRLALAPGAPAFAYWEHDTPSAWEAAIATGHENERFGCLRAESDGASQSIEVCRTKQDADRTQGAPGDPDAEAVVVRITECRAACTTTEHRASAGADPSWGDLLGLEIDAACTQVRVADGVGAGGEPRWQTLASPCFDDALVRQGIARAADASIEAGPSLFVGVRRNGVFVSAADIAGVRVAGVDDPSVLLDLSSP